MAMCKFCGKAFAWGQEDGRWRPLVPIGEDADLDRDYQDENGVLRAAHSLVCVNKGGPAVRISKLAKKVKAKEIIGAPWGPPNPETGEVLPTLPAANFET